MIQATHSEHKGVTRRVADRSATCSNTGFDATVHPRRTRQTACPASRCADSRNDKTATEVHTTGRSTRQRTDKHSQRLWNNVSAHCFGYKITETKKNTYSFKKCKMRRRKCCGQGEIVAHVERRCRRVNFSTPAAAVSPLAISRKNTRLKSTTNNVSDVALCHIPWNRACFAEYAAAGHSRLVTSHGGL